MQLVVVGVVIQVTVPVAILGLLVAVVGIVEVVNEIPPPTDEAVKAVMPVVASTGVL